MASLDDLKRKKRRLENQIARLAGQRTDEARELLRQLNALNREISDLEAERRKKQ